MTAPSGGSHHPNPSDDQLPSATPGPASGTRRRRWVLAAAGVTVAVGAVIAVAAAFLGGDRAAQATEHNLRDIPMGEISPTAAPSTPDLPPVPTAAAPAPTGPPARAAESTPAAPPCGQRLRLWSSQARSAGAHQYRSLVLEVTWGDPCTISGYPALTFAAADGTPVDVTATPGGGALEADPGSHVVTMNPSDHVYAAIQWDSPTPGGDPAVLVSVTPTTGAPTDTVQLATDITAGTQVHITAWALGDGHGG